MNVITLRPAELTDSALIFNWRNSEAVRQYSFSRSFIPFAQHQAWFEKILQASHRFILIAEQNTKPIGVFRVDGEEAYYEISLYLNPEEMGKKYGEQLLSAGIAWVKEHLPHTKKLTAKVMAGNVASTKIFERQGFLQTFVAYEKNLNPEG